MGLINMKFLQFVLQHKPSVTSSKILFSPQFFQFSNLVWNKQTKRFTSSYLLNKLENGVLDMTNFTFLSASSSSHLCLRNEKIQSYEPLPKMINI